jgi:hypothetical protein
MEEVMGGQVNCQLPSGLSPAVCAMLKIDDRLN